MPIFERIEDEDANEEVEQTYRKIKARYGGALPDIYKAFANDPEYLASINEHMTRVLRPRKVDAKTKEVIAFVVAAMNGCDFCLNATRWVSADTGTTTRRSQRSWGPRRSGRR